MCEGIILSAGCPALCRHSRVACRCEEKALMAGTGPAMTSMAGHAFAAHIHLTPVNGVGLCRAMNHNVESADTEQAGNAEEQVTAWLCATSEDLASVDFEAPLDGAMTADCHELSDLYRAAIQPS